MNANGLLLWVSARSQGSWQQFRGAIEQLHLEAASENGEDRDAPHQVGLPLYHSLRFNLQRIGHVEFFAGAGDAEWRVTPPSIAITQTPRGFLGTIVGARTRKVLDRITATHHDISVETVGIDGYPDQLLVTASQTNALQTFAERVGLAVQEHAPSVLLMSLPAVDAASVRYAVPLPFGAGWNIERFSTHAHTWRDATRDEAVTSSGGLFRFTLGYQRFVFYCSKGKSFRIPGQVGKYLALRQSRRRLRRLVRYDRQQRTLIVPAVYRPPFLIERALILCSGLPPLFCPSEQRGSLTYTEIPEHVASIAASLLRQELL